MKITAIELGMLRAPLRTAFKTALRTVSQVEDVVVRIHTDSGAVGHGSAPATAAITGDTHESIIHAIGQVFAPLLVGANIAEGTRLGEQIHGALPRNTNAKAAIDIALHDLLGQLHGQPLYRLLGGGNGRPRLRTDLTISVDSLEKMLLDVEDALARGFDVLKVKIGTDPAQDVQRTIAIHAAINGRARIRLDANQGWTAAQAVQAMQAIEAAGVELELVEQPVKASDVDGLRHVRANVRTPVMADEAVFDPEQARMLLDTAAADILNIKLMKTAGIAPALRIADIATQAGAGCMVGCMLESSIGVAAAAHVAAARAAVVRHIDLDGPELCAIDPVTSNVRFDGPDIRIGDAPGLGITRIDGYQPL